MVGVTSSSAGSWSLAASLAAATAAGAYRAHLRAAEPAAAEGGDLERQPEGSGSEAATAGPSTTSSSNSSSAGAAGDVSPAEELVEGGLCPADCSVCSSATQLLITLLCLERGVAPPSTTLNSVRVGMLATSAQQRGTTLQQHLRQQLLAMAWRHPVPGVCGNVLCERLDGPAAVGVVMNRVGTLCGGCRAAWYCCKACQRAARAGHWQACRVASAAAVAAVAATCGMC
jgi:hypothetical protein